MPTRSSSSVRIFYPKFDQAYLLRILPERLKMLQRELQLLRVVLFGSYAKGNFTVGSDVDLLIVYRGEERADAYAIAKRTLDIPQLEPHLYSEEEYKKMERIISRMSDGGILIFPEERPTSP
jgi:hypothetical protein